MSKTYKPMRVYAETLEKLRVISALQHTTMIKLIADFADREYVAVMNAPRPTARPIEKASPPPLSVLFGKDVEQ